MNKKLIPTYLANSIYEIDFDKLVKMNIKTIFFDLDNTLASPHSSLPDEKTKKLIKKVKEMGFNIIVLSNNHEDRVKLFADEIDCKYLFEVRKPSSKKMKKYISDNNLNVNECIEIGDQIMTDVLLSNKVNIKVILTKPLVNKDLLITFVPRLLDKHFRKKINKKNLAKEF